MATLVNRFLLLETGDYLLLEGDLYGRIIIGQDRKKGGGRHGGPWPWDLLKKKLIQEDEEFILLLLNED